MVPRITGVWADYDRRWRLLVTKGSHRPGQWTRLYMTVQEMPDEDEVRMPTQIYLVFPKKDYYMQVKAWTEGRGGRVLAEGRLYRPKETEETRSVRHYEEAEVTWDDATVEEDDTLNWIEGS